jgi:fumarate reductase subunit D
MEGPKMIELFERHQLGKAIRRGSEVGAVVVLILMIFELWADRHAIGFGLSNMRDLLTGL